MTNLNEIMFDVITNKSLMRRLNKVCMSYHDLAEADRVTSGNSYHKVILEFLIDEYPEYFAGGTLLGQPLYPHLSTNDVGACASITNRDARKPGWHICFDAEATRCIIISSAYANKQLEGIYGRNYLLQKDYTQFLRSEALNKDIFEYRVE